ncbi:hypothetical protein [Siccibacter colletis]|uniref:hypothetical protein n=1 Tax=Siccibacter colletis TaxID=1505757 RepID=UPI003CF6C10E
MKSLIAVIVLASLSTTAGAAMSPAQQAQQGLNAINQLNAISAAHGKPVDHRLDSLQRNYQATVNIPQMNQIAAPQQQQRVPHSVTPHVVSAPGYASSVAPTQKAPNTLVAQVTPTPKGINPSAPKQPSAPVNYVAAQKAALAAPTINVAASSLPAKTPVQTPQGVKPAGTLPPHMQVSVPFKSAFHPQKKGGHDGATKGGYRGDHGTGTGGDNQHDHAMGGHTGAGGGFHM